ncbi:MAG: DUF6046 domain-containing protein [Marinifilaceae bacterium]|jgi:hypothetical protein|nr:DUF6046 domain-containing protein [Marinifilaceae bacterium]
MSKEYDIKQILQSTHPYEAKPFPLLQSRPDNLNAYKSDESIYEFEQENLRDSDPVSNNYNSDYEFDQVNKRDDKAKSNSYNSDFKFDIPEREDVKLTKKGVVLRRPDFLGNYYFMPVTFVRNNKKYEIDLALVSITAKKKIVSTPLVGRMGSIKELINIADYSIDIQGAIIGENQQWPEDKIQEFYELFSFNESLEIICALTSVFLGDNDRVIIKDISLPATQGVEHVQKINIKCESDRKYELIIE